MACVIQLIHESLRNGKVSGLSGLNCFQFELIEGLLFLLETLCQPFSKEKSSDETKEVPKMVLVFNELCKLIQFEVQAEQDPEGQITCDWENARMTIADTLTTIARFESVDQLNKEPTEEDRTIYGASKASPMLRLFETGTKNLKALADSNVPSTVV